MKQITLYYAGDWGPRPQQGDLGITNRLISYLYPHQREHWLRVNGDTKGSVIIDSGAFSAWNKGDVIDIYEYMKYITETVEKLVNANKTVYYVNLDVIPGKVGQTKNLNKFIGNKNILENNNKIVNEAAKQGLENLKLMIREGFQPIHVFHQGEHIRWLEEMIKHTDYIGIAPANDVSMLNKKKWIYAVFEYMYKHGIDVRTHGFAVTMPELLEHLPWTTCDSISWLMISATGQVIYPLGGFQNPKFRNDKKPYNRLTVSKVLSGKGTTYLTDGILELFERDGYTYEQLQDYSVRMEINVRTMLLYEKWLNEKKQNEVYSPVPTFFTL